MSGQSRNRQLAINLTATFVSTAVTIAISFFLTPFIVGALGAAAYGFVGLSSNVIGYTQLVTIALNSMAGRFITIAYQQGRIDDANRYFSSVFFSNIFLSIFILLSMAGCVLYLDCFFEIPPELVVDTKILFSLLVVNTIIGLLTNVYSIATFIKNRLELSNIRIIFGNIIRAALLLLLFSLFHPCLWYLGITSIVTSIYIAFTNYQYTKRLTPELRISYSSYDFSKVKELLSSGSWSVISKVNNMLAQGLDLVVANVLIGPVAMGMFSISKVVPSFVYSFFGQAASVFAPSLTELYAKGEMASMKQQLLQSIRVMGFLSTIPAVCLYTFGREFYALWMPSQDVWELYVLTILGTVESVLSMPLESLWNIFTITNKIKYSTNYILVSNVLSFCIILSMLPFVEGLYMKLYVFLVIRLVFALIKDLFFLPLFGAKCMNFQLTTFYPVLGKSVLCFALSFVLCYALQSAAEASTWGGLIGMSVISVSVCMIVNYYILFEKADREYINAIVHDKVMLKFVRR